MRVSPRPKRFLVRSVRRIRRSHSKNEEARELVHSRPVGERRTFRIAPIDGVLWFCVFTMREEKIRLISVRHVRPEEKELYEQN